MKCCNKVKAIRPTKRFSGLRGDELRREVERETGCTLRGKTEEITHLVKNFEVFADPDTLELHQEAFQEMLGFIGHSFLGERLFYVVKQPTR